MRIISLGEIQNVITYPDAIEAVKSGFVSYSNGLINQPEPMQIFVFKNVEW